MYSNKNRHTRLALCLIGSLTLAGSAYGQAPAPNRSGSGTAPTVAPQATPGSPGADCVVPPQSGSGTPSTPGTGSTPSGQLSNCNGVLTPPAVGDGELVEPAPPVGQMPVIRPQDVPPNAPDGTKRP